MARTIQSLVTALLIGATVTLFTVNVVAPLLPPFVGPPDVKETKSLKLPSANQLWLSNADGAVRVKTHEEGSKKGIEVQAEVSLYLDGKVSEADVERYLGSLVVTEQDEELLKVVTEPSKRPDWLDLRVEYTITVPRGTDVEINGSNGNVWVEEGCGAVAVHGGNTDIEIRGPSGFVVAKSVNGRIRASDVENDATLETENGDIYAYMEAGDLYATTSNGDVIAHALGSGSDTFELSSQNGGVTIVLAEDPSVSVALSTGKGFIKSDFAFGSYEDGVLDAKRVTGVLGGGDLKLTAESLNGNIWLKKI